MSSKALKRPNEAGRSGESSLRLPDGRRIRAVLFDLDGTLYRQRPLRRRMAVELALHALKHPRQSPALLRVLRHFRRAQEHLRSAGHHRGLAAAQIGEAATNAGVEPAIVSRMVDEWMHTRPLRHLARTRTAGALELLDFLAGAQVPVGVLSDYPAARKLAALGLSARVAWSICSTDPDVEAFKPHPRGFLRACERFALPARDVLMVGDRADADAAGAAAAGMPCVILEPVRRADSTPYLSVPSFERLHRVLDDRR